MVQVATQQFLWVHSSGSGLERTTVELADDRVQVSGQIIGPDATPFTIDYTVECDENWRTRKVQISDSLNGHHRTLLGDGLGAWTDGDGGFLPQLDGAIDVDISATPFTNTLPIRRLHLEVGEQADIVTAHISVPDLTLLDDPQRYTRLTGTVYRYQSLDSDFSREITVDHDGFVVDYPGLFTRRA